jgi:hypothetical protein
LQRGGFFIISMPAEAVYIQNFYHYPSTR